MALIKKVMTPYGVEAGYWKVGRAVMDVLEGEGSYTIMLYIDKDAESFIDCKTISLNGLSDKTRIRSIVDGDSGLIKACYEDAKVNDKYFKDATDDPDYIEESKGGEDVDKPEDTTVENTTSE